MKTELDTFNRLRRPTWDQMGDIIFSAHCRYITNQSQWPVIATRLYERNHWTEEEFIQEYMRRYSHKNNNTEY